MELHEQHEYAAMICAKLVDSVLTCEELDFVAYQMGVKRSEFYPEQERKEALEVIDWNERKAA